MFAFFLLIMSAPAPLWKPGAFTITEAPDSRLTEYNERLTFTQQFDGTYNDCVANLLSRGTVGTPTGTSGTWIVESSTVKRDRGQKGRLTIKWLGAIIFPPQEAGFEPENQQPPIARHPLFRALQPDDFRMVQRAYDALTAAGQNSNRAAFAKSSNPDLCLKLYEKLANGNETYYLAGVRYSWTSFYAYGSQPPVNVGGYIEIPGGPFSSQAVGDGSISWLRESDQHRLLSGLLSIVAVTRHWLGAPDSHWDEDLYAG
jgi:hypothetical protein